MSDQTQPESLKDGDSDGAGAAGGVKIKGQGDVAVGGNIAGRDMVTTTTTTVGFSASAVQRLLLIVGALVFITAACFFTGGVVVGGALIEALNRPVEVSQSAADAMQAKLDVLQGLAPGTPFQASFSEAELNSYWQLVAGPQVGLTPGTGAVRLLDGNRIALAGQFAALSNLKAVAVVKPQLNSPGHPFQLDSAGIRVLSLGQTTLGWLPVPTSALEPAMGSVNNLFGSGLVFTSATVAGSNLTVSGVGH